MSDIIKDCYQKSLELLKDNVVSHGVLAAGRSGRAVKRNYLSVFGRDAGICALGQIASRDPDLVRAARISLESLAQKQALNGQIPNYVKGRGEVDFWRMGCIDATLWWLLAVDYYCRRVDKKFARQAKRQIRLALDWAMCQEHPADGLLVQNEASDWADLMPRSGKVLYSNSLWIMVKERYDLPGAKASRRNFNNLFHPFAVDLGKLPKRQKTTAAMIKKEKKLSGHYVSFANYLYYGHDLDVLGNSLAILAGLAGPKLRKQITAKILGARKKKKMPIPVLFNPIEPSSPLWRSYMESHRQNYPYQYQNGGIWPFAACFWAMALAKSGQRREARRELELIAQANRRNNWEFNEWFNAKSSTPMGMKKQSWNAGAFLLAWHCLVEKDADF